MNVSWLIPVLILIPNLLWMLFPPIDMPRERPEKPNGRLPVILEWMGRIGVFVIPVFYVINVASTVQVVGVGIMALALLVYYAGWARYFLRGRAYALLFKPLLGLPIPLAISPVLYFAAASVLLGSWPLALATALLGVAHIPISYRDYRRLVASTPVENEA